MDEKMVIMQGDGSCICQDCMQNEDAYAETPEIGWRLGICDICAEEED